MTDVPKEMIAAISGNPSDLSLRNALSDWYEEHGEPDLAFCHRWMAKRGKWPKKYAGGGAWQVVGSTEAGRRPHNLQCTLFHWWRDALSVKSPTAERSIWFLSFVLASIREELSN